MPVVVDVSKTLSGYPQNITGVSAVVTGAVQGASVTASAPTGNAVLTATAAAGFARCNLNRAGAGANYTAVVWQVASADRFFMGSGIYTVDDTSLFIGFGGGPIAGFFTSGRMAVCDGTNPITPSAFLDVAGAIAGASSFRIRAGATVTSPNDGDIWYDGTNLKMRIAGATRNFTLV